MNNDNRSGTQGGSHQQHVQAGQQSHKNSQPQQSNTASVNNQGSHAGKQGGSHEQHVSAGQQSHKNTSSQRS